MKTRFAPSNTGLMHPGNLRTAYFCWLLGNKEYILRIEDTDKERSEEKYTENILEILQWCGIPWTGEVIYQSKRFDLYRKIALSLYQYNYAYYCQCVEEICICTNLTSGSLRFRMPKDTLLKFTDVLFGDTQLNSKELFDFTLLREDETPTYALAVVVDDFFSGIELVIRGEEHKKNTFKQILLWDIFNIYEEIYSLLNGKKNIPQYLHLPIILNTNKQKLSKRNGDKSIQYYKEEGIVPEAILNLILKTGWGYENKEIIDKNEALDIFSIKNLRKSPSIFDDTKLYNFSRKYMNKYNYLPTLIKELPNYNIDQLKILYDEVVKRINTLNEFKNYVKFLETYNGNFIYYEELKGLEYITWNLDQIKEYLNSLNIKDLYNQLRLHLTQSNQSVPIPLLVYSYLSWNNFKKYIYCDKIN